MNFYYMKCLNMSWVSALLMCQEISMVMATEAYEINKSKTGHPVVPYYFVSSILKKIDRISLLFSQMLNIATIFPRKLLI